MQATTTGTETHSETNQVIASDAVVADINRVNAESLSWCLKAYGGFRNVTAIDNSGELVTTIRSQRPQVILVGERMIVRSIREIFGEMAIRLGETRIAVFGDALTDRQLDLVVNNKVTGLLSRRDGMRTISDQLVQIAGGTPILSEKLTGRASLGRDGVFSCTANSRLEKLTDRQWDVLLRIAEGLRVSEVAAALSLTEKAVEAHKYRIMRTIGAHDRVDLCRWAIREGLIEA